MSNNINDIKNSENALTANMNSKELSALEKIQDYAFNSYKDVAWKNPKLEEINKLSVDDKIHKIINDNIKMLNENTINDKSSMKNVAESIMQQIRKAFPEIETAIDNEVNRDYKKHKKEYNKKRTANKDEIKQSIKNAALGAKLRDILIKATTTLMTEVQTKKATETINQIESIEQTKKQQEKEMKKIAKEETAKFLKKKQWYDRKTKLERWQKQAISEIKRIEESQAFHGCNTILHIAKKQMPAYKIKNTIKKIPKIIKLSFANEFLKSNEDRIKALNSGNKIDAQAIVVSLQQRIALHIKAINATHTNKRYSDEVIKQLSYIYLIEMSNNFIKNRKQKLAQLKNRLNKITSLMKVADNNIQLLETQNQNTTSVKPKASITSRNVQYPKEKKPMKIKTKIKLTNQIKNKGFE